MLRIINIFSPLKKIFSIRLIKIYSLTFCVFLIAKTDGYACDAGYTGHIKFSNKTNIPIDIVVLRINKEDIYLGECIERDVRTKKCKLRSTKDFFVSKVIKKMKNEKITVQAKTTSGGLCWVDRDKHKNKWMVSHFKTSFKYNGKTVQGPAGEIGASVRSVDARGHVRKHKGNQKYITSSGCNNGHHMCTVDFKLKK